MDEVRGIAYITTGGPKPNFNGVRHRGQNLFCNCLIALDARTGRRLWHFQEIRHDIWDLDMSAPPNLATITRDGRRVDVVAATTKIGNTILLDRLTGQPIFPFRLRRAPTSTLPGEQTWPYQPDLELPEPFSELVFTEARPDGPHAGGGPITRWRASRACAPAGSCRWPKAGPRCSSTLMAARNGRAHALTSETGRLYVTANHIGWAITMLRDDDPPDDPHAPKTPGQKIFETACAACHGANRLGVGVTPPLRGVRHRLTDAADHPADSAGQERHAGQHPAQRCGREGAGGLSPVARPSRCRPWPPRPERPVYSFAGYPRFYDQEGYPANKPPWGTLNCLDLNTGKLVWKVPLGEYPELAADGVPQTGTENYGGAIVTAGGLLFVSGTRDNKIRAFDKTTGAGIVGGRRCRLRAAPRRPPTSSTAGNMW